MEDRKSYKLYSLAEWINGMAFRDINFSSKGLPVIKIAEIKSGISGQTKFTDSTYDSKYLIKKGDMLFCWSGQPETSIGTFWWQEEDGWLNQHIFKVLPNENIVTKDFFFYILQSLKPHFVEIARNKQTTGLGHVTKKDLERIDVLIPPFEEQKAIAKILSSLDDKIELNRRMNETLEAIARALFKAWFVDFEPVRANTENRPSESASPEIAKLFPSEFEDSEFGWISKDWMVSTIGNFASVIDCLHSKKPERQKEGKPFLQLWNIRDDGLIDLTDTYFITEEDYNKWTSRIEAQEGDCVITNVGRVGVCAQIPYGQKAALGRNMTAIRCKKENPYPTFLVELLRWQKMREEISNKTDVGTILDALNVKNISKLRFVMPNQHSILVEFENKIRKIRLKIEQHHKQNTTLKEVRDSLLPRLISGKVRIGESKEEISHAI